MSMALVEESLAAAQACIKLKQMTLRG